MCWRTSWRAEAQRRPRCWRRPAPLPLRALDLASPASIDAFAADVAAREGAIDGLVNNGAIATGIGGPRFEEIDIEVWDRVMAVNVRGTWLMTRAMAPLLRRGNAGRIVNVASDTALWGAPRCSPMSPARAR